MTIPKETIDAWKSLIEPGDIKKLKELTGLAKSTLYKLLNDGKCTSVLVAGKMGSFFNKRKQEKAMAEKILQEQD